MRLKNPERGWTHVTPPLERSEVEARIGATAEPLALLPGGLSNRNVRVGRDRVLRIFRDPATVGKEVALMTRAWRTFRTPAVLARGSDFVVLEHVEHEPLSDDTAVGAAVGRALAEIHATHYALSGFLGDDLAVARPFPGDGHEGLTPHGYGRWELSEQARHLPDALVARVAQFLDTEPLARRNAIDVPVLSHCDFKASNVHWATAIDQLLVLDWEFAWAGSRYIDIGQMLRWQPAASFVRAFADAYVAGGGVLTDDWRRFAEIVDLGSLIGLLRNPAARATDEIVGRIREIVER